MRLVTSYCAVIQHQSGLVRDQADTTLTFLAQRNLLNDTLVAEVLLIHSTNYRDGLIRPKVSDEWHDNIKVWVGMDIFYGNQTGLFGQFARNDRLVVGVGDVILTKNSYTSTVKRSFFYPAQINFI